jgi:WD40 repeat protein
MNTAHFILSLLLLPTIIFGQKPELGIPVGHSDVIQTVALSPDGVYALSGSRDKTVKLWESSSGKLIRTWNPHRKDDMGTVVVMSVAFAYNSGKKYAIAASVGSRHPIMMWDIETGELLGSLTENKKDTMLSDPGALLLSVSQDGKFVMAVTHIEGEVRKEAKGVKIWRVKDGDIFHSFPIQKKEVKSICFSPDHKFVWLGMIDGSIAQWTMKGLEAEQTFSIHNDPVKALRVREDGMLVSVSKDKVVIIDPLDGKIIKKKALNDSVLKGNSVSIAPNGNTIFYESNDIQMESDNGQVNLVQYQMKLKDIAAEGADTLMRGHKQSVSASSFSEDGQFVLSGSHDRTLILWDVESHKMIRQFGGFSKMLSKVSFSPDKKRALILPRFSSEFKVWNLEKGDYYATLHGHNSEIITTCFSPTGENILFSSIDKSIHVWNVEEEKIIGSFPKRNTPVKVISFSPDGSLVLFGTKNGNLECWNVENKTQVQSLPRHMGSINSLAWSKDGNLVFSGSKDGLIRVDDLKNPSKSKKVQLSGKLWSPVAFSPDGQTFINISCQKFQLEWWDIKGDSIIQTYALDDFPCGSTSNVRFSPDGETFLFSSGNDIIYWRVGEEKPIKKLSGHSEWVNSVDFSSDSYFGISGGYDGQVNIWELPSELEAPLASIIMLDSSDWVVHTSSGLFDSSPGGFDLLYFLVDMELIDLEQLKERYWEPGLLPILLRLKGGSVRDVEKLDLLPQYPLAELEIDEEKNLLKIDLKKRSGGIGKVSLYINGKEVNADINDKRSKHISEDLTVYQDYFPKGENSRIAVQVFNEEGWLRSPFYELNYEPGKVLSKGKGGDDEEEVEVEIDDDPFYEPQLRAIIVGTSDYSGGDIDLSFADDDAKRITIALKEAGRLLFGEGIHIESFVSDANEQSKVGSKANIKQAFEKVASEAHPKDVLFLFFSGHGKTIGDDFYYLTKDISSMKNLDKDANRREQFAISSREMMEWIRKIKANKQILILDACHSGKATEILSAGRDLTSTQTRALDQLKDRMGMYILASSEANQKSFETAELGQGLLTYTILLGMKGAAKDDNESGDDRTLDVLSLLSYATNNVPDFAKGIVEKTQQPVLIIPKTSTSFPIGIVNDQVNIPIPPKKSIIVHSVFMEKQHFGDPIGLSTQLDEVIKDNTKPGIGQNKIFLNVKNYPDAYSIKGLYSIEGDNITVEWKLFNGVRSKGPFVTKGLKTEPESLSMKIFNKALAEW